MERQKFYDNVVTVPATKVAGATSYTSIAYKDFIGSAFGGAKIIFGATDVSKITDNFTVVPQVSYDGLNYYDFSSYTDLLSSAGSAAVAEVISVTITAGCSGNGSVTVTLPGLAAVPVAVTTAASTAINVATLVRNATYTGWTAGGTSADVTFTKNVAGDVSGVPTIAFASTGVTATGGINVTTQGKNANYAVGFAKLLTIAPYLKVKLVSDATGALASGHGINVDIVMLEAEEKYGRKIFADALPVTSLSAGFADQYSSVIDLGDGKSAYKMYLCMYIADKSKVVDAIRYVVETSDDKVNWVACSAVVTDIANGSGLAHSQTLVTDGSTYELGRYFRIKLYRNSNDVDAAIASSSGLKFNLIFLY
jgi:hypothetical protein